ncbi:deoxyhypusine hydroxylase [Agrilus planipennis]|uniref:Deoxyhypusine hydroxylase n=1 Tax=Agrilus planipennis TaxID=224129 RepID=A0A1W4WZ90_AGRPL|nr:deoxyhypusine hydroxylase [Agrilus planipennis]
MVNINESQIRDIGKVLNDVKRPLKERFRALFTLRNIGGSTSIECIGQCFADSSALLKHELAYCLGQMQDESAIDLLIKVLQDTGQEPMVRHEAAEALGAIGSIKVIPVLEKYVNDPVIEVAETCQLALDRIKWLNSKENTEKSLSKNPYNSVDPAPPMNVEDVNKLKDVLLNHESLFERYRAMFALRNLRTKESIEALALGLKQGGALFRHEIAFVLGQLQDELSVPYLIESLEDSSENEMVRHECAEALGAIATEQCFEILQKYLQDKKQVVKESCEIALDMCEYENSPEFQYANTFQIVDQLN